METPKRLNPRQRKYVKEYVKTGNGTQSVMKAYKNPNPKTAAIHAVQLNQRPLVIKAIEEHLAEANYSPTDSIKEIQKATKLGLLNSKSAKVSDTIRGNELLLKLSGKLVDRKHTTKFDINSKNLAELLQLKKKYDNLIG